MKEEEKDGDIEKQQTPESKQEEDANQNTSSNGKQLIERMKNSDVYQYSSKLATNPKRLARNLRDLGFIGFAGYTNVALSAASITATVAIACATIGVIYINEVSKLSGHQARLKSAQEKLGATDIPKNSSLKNFLEFLPVLMVGAAFLAVYIGLAYSGNSPAMANGSIALATMLPSLARKAMVARVGYQADKAEAEVKEKEEQERYEQEHEEIFEKTTQVLDEELEQVKEINQKYSANLNLSIEHGDELEIDVPHDGNCLFWSAAMAHLLPARNDEQLFNARFERLFGADKRQHRDTVRNLLNNYNPRGDMNQFFENPLLNRLVTQTFRNHVVNTIERNLTSFPGLEQEFNMPVDEYLDSMRNTGEWGGHPEILAIGALLDANIRFVSGNNEQIFRPNANMDGTSQITLVHVATNSENNEAQVRTHYHFQADKNLFGASAQTENKQSFDEILDDLLGRPLDKEEFDALLQSVLNGSASQDRQSKKTDKSADIQLPVSSVNQNQDEPNIKIEASKPLESKESNESAWKKEGPALSVTQRLQATKDKSQSQTEPENQKAAQEGVIPTRSGSPRL